MAARARRGLWVAMVAVLSPGFGYAEEAATDDASLQEKVAVLDFVIRGVSADEIKGLNADLSAAVALEVAALGFEVVSMQDIRAMLSFEGQKQLLGCETDASCLAEIGGALGVELVISGSVFRTDADYRLSLTLMDTAVARVKGRFGGNAGTQSVLRDTVRRGVLQLFGEGDKEIRGAGFIVVSTDPPGAAVMLDGRDLGYAPVSADDVSPGEHVVEAFLGDLRGKVIVNVRPETTARITVKLGLAPPVKIKVLSTPPDAQVFLDGKPVGRTPVILKDVPAGKHEIRLEHDDALTDERKVTFSYDEYDRSGRKPLKYEVALDRILRLPVKLSVTLGAVGDARTLGEGVAFSSELGVRLPWGFEFGAGFSSPAAIPISLRWWAFQKEFEFGVFGRIIPLKRQINGIFTLDTLGGGLVVGYGVKTVFGYVGLRLEAMFARDVDIHVSMFPLLAGVVWRGL